MDIQVSSNFERFLYYVGGEKASQVAEWMDSFKETGKLTLSGDLLEFAQSEMLAERASQEEILETIKKVHQETGYILDPHTAVGVCAAEKIGELENTVCLATAHPAKFSDAVETAIGQKPDLPESLAKLKSCETRCQNLPATGEAVKQFMVETLKK